MFKYTLDNKRYHTFNYFLRNKFGCKVFKVPLDAHATCPNKINGGCIFCKDNSKSNITNENNDIITQFNEEIKLLNKKQKNDATPNSVVLIYKNILIIHLPTVHDNFFSTRRTSKNPRLN